VFLTEKDAFLLGEALKMGYNEFTEAFCRWIPSINRKEQLSLKEKSNFDCVFWVQGEGCSVYEARPLQCRAFPFWLSVAKTRESWKMTAESCPGMDKGILHSRDSIEKWLALQQCEPIIFRSI